MSLADFSLEGKKALVVGGRRNMGKGFALGLAEAGADVAVTDLRTEDGRLQRVAEEIRDMGRKSVVVQSDISSKVSVDSLVSVVMEKLGGIDILMNVAVMYHHKSLVDLDEDGWNQLTNVNLKGYWLMHQAVGPIMQAQGSGSIINLSSRGGLKAHADRGMGNYAIVKAGITMMTRQYSRYFGPSNVRVNAIAPSLVEWEEHPAGDFYRENPERAPRENLSRREPTELEKFESWSTGPENLPLGRVASFEEMANAAVFLASDASSYITGTILCVDGGYMA
ncbi:MAG: SDR family oxidoreductase [Gammaproteobacteria bacterium]|jgi:NAD(P)-dependent dehydrogenase (short-subunit alcohol dehydrogenase family)|nr:SDR family oxidoreductase [Gammaproteobacteria bacterium]MBT5204195.1 SDR family oxidoreductase [Gammaproteobacteria bacterium]MBT6246707.1 SDR family oxidoreductase [Gammaproteobacteria bacterium]